MLVNMWESILYMKTFLIQNDGLIKNMFCIAFVVDVLIFLICYFYNKNAYKKIVKIYEEKIGGVPLDTILCKNASVFSTPYLYGSKVRFITRSLNFKYNNHLHHDVSIEGYNLIRNLPKKLTLGFRIETLSLLIFIPIMIGIYILL